mgnify:CR=1 FL=1
MFKELYLKSIKLAGHKNSKSFLGFFSFIESFIFPIPPDVIIIPMAIAKKNEWFKIALIATICSVLGACFGYFIGYVFFNEVGIKIFEIFGAENANIFKEKLANETGLLSGVIILFIAGFTPLPFKIITISSGFVHFNILLFILTCFVARGLRFFLVAYLSYKYGAAIGPLLEKKGTQWTVIITGIIVIIIAIIYFILKQ